MPRHIQRSSLRPIRILLASALFDLVARKLSEAEAMLNKIRRSQLAEFKKLVKVN